MFACRTMTLLGALASLPVAALRAQSAIPLAATTSTLTGFVHDEANAPITSAELSLARTGEATRSARTGADGHFQFTGVQPGDVQLSVRRMGFKAFTKAIKVGDQSASRAIDVSLQTVPTDVNDVVVEGENAKLHEFYVRRDHNNFGKYFDGAEIMKRDPRIMSDLLRTIPGASIGASTRIGNRLLLRGCKPTIWLNGMKAFGAELDEVANPSDVAGLEIYMSWAGLPPQFQDRENPGCGAIIVWTKDS